MIIKPGGNYVLPNKDDICNITLENEGDDLAKVELLLNNNIYETLEILPHSTQSKMVNVRGKVALSNIGKTHVKIL